MFVDLRTLKPNPMRDFGVDPLDQDRIDELAKSIQEDGFWGGIVCRQTPGGDVQIGAGHHRVAAAIKAGETTADVFVTDMDNASMVRVYARENATQRGNLGTAQVGSVASALRFIAKAVLGGGCEQLFTTAEIDAVRGNLLSEKGIGRKIIVKFLGGVPGISDRTVQEAIANIKASGDYARIIHEIQEEIERENREALASLERAEREQKEADERAKAAEQARKEATARAKAAREEADKRQAELDRQWAEEKAKLAEKRRQEAAETMKGFDSLRKTRDTSARAVQVSSGKPITFDLEGVAKHFKNPHQLDVFRQQVTGQGIAPYLAVNKQAELAGHLVALAKSMGRELSADFIKENVTALVLNVKDEERRLTKEEQEKIARQDLTVRAKRYQDQFCTACYDQVASATRLKELWDSWPKGVPFPVSFQFRNAIEKAKVAISTLSERI